MNQAYHTIAVACFPPNVVAAACFDLAAILAPEGVNYEQPGDENASWLKSVGVVRLDDIRFI